MAVRINAVVECDSIKSNLGYHAVGFFHLGIAQMTFHWSSKPARLYANHSPRKPGKIK